MKENVPITDPVWMVDPNWMQKTGGYAKDMTLHQWYAGLAMQSLIARTDWDTDDPDFYSNWAYEMADAMLKARDGK
jgi:hypothetical protein